MGKILDALHKIADALKKIGGGAIMKIQSLGKKRR